MKLVIAFALLATTLVSSSDPKLQEVHHLRDLAKLLELPESVILEIKETPDEAGKADAFAKGLEEKIRPETVDPAIVLGVLEAKGRCRNTFRRDKCFQAKMAELAKGMSFKQVRQVFGEGIRTEELMPQQIVKLWNGFVRMLK